MSRWSDQHYHARLLPMTGSLPAPLVVVAELMGHSRLDTTWQYSSPTEQDKAEALNHLTTDH
jgi:hypothetical protein